jgi:hypothetical protein
MEVAETEMAEPQPDYEAGLSIDVNL